MSCHVYIYLIIIIKIINYQHFTGASHNHTSQEHISTRTTVNIHSNPKHQCLDSVIDTEFVSIYSYSVQPL